MELSWAEIVNGGFIEYKADNKANKKVGAIINHLSYNQLNIQ